MECSAKAYSYKLAARAVICK